ncbi:nonsense-mediated mRNA decay factor SMG7-like [Artemia franciscana]|uniref:Protein SMG7 n=1 Tax=Artemia franciscana TaxID=6661 RepID=A0AA88L6V9_ARTSF|nr:hypothetical protein QYM36_004865 [Artemia franciscana]
MKSKEELKRDIARLKNDLSSIALSDEVLIAKIEDLQECYGCLLLQDLDQSLDDKIELDLWNYCFKGPISKFQSKMSNRKDPKYRELKSRYQHILELSMGFYLSLLESLKEQNDLAFPEQKKDGSKFIILKKQRIPAINEPSRSSLLYLTQHVYIHLGDLARYRRFLEEAEAYYKQAVGVEPSNGHAYNQLALLEAAGGIQLSVVFYYVRSVCVKHPFPPGMANLEKVYSKLMEGDPKLSGKARLNVSDFVTCFLTCMAHLYSMIGLNRVVPLGRLLGSSLSALVAVEAFSAWKLVQISVILLHTLHHSSYQMGAASNDNSLVALDEQKSYEQGLDIFAMTLNGLLLAAYTLSPGQNLLEFPGLPAVKLLLLWIRLNPSILLDRSFVSRLQIWPTLARLLNSLQESKPENTDGLGENIPLPEDFDVREFLPLQKYLKTLDFKSSSELTYQNTLNLRVRRLLDLGHSIASLDSARVLTVKCHEDGRLIFEAAVKQGGEVTKELQELSIAKEEILTKGSTPSSDLSQTSSQASEDFRNNNDLPKRAVVLDEAKKGILKIPNGGIDEGRKTEDNKPTSEETRGNMKIEEKKGILKVLLPDVAEEKPKKPKNVAISAILRKNAEEKQKEEDERERTTESKTSSKVTFRTHSPPLSHITPEPSQQFKNLYLERLMLEQRKRNQEAPHQEEYVLFGPRNPIIPPISQPNTGWNPSSFTPIFPPPIYPRFPAGQDAMQMMNGNMPPTTTGNWGRAGLAYPPITPPLLPDFRHPPPGFFQQGQVTAAANDQPTTNGNTEETGSYKLFNTSWPTLTSTVPPPQANATGSLTEGRFGFPGMERTHPPQQALWSAAGPSPLEKLLEFQRGQSKT